MSQHPVFTSALPTGDDAGHILIVGGGASGVLMATHLLSAHKKLRVTILESANLLGCGLAYSTRDPDHLLNTRVHNMSAFPEDPFHFHRWLQGRSEGRGLDEHSFVSRATYGAYLSDLLRPWSLAEEERRLTCLRRKCIRIEERPDGVLAHLEGGDVIGAQIAVLATGHVLPRPDPAGLLTGAWEGVCGLDPDAGVLIIGSGLSMVDQVLSLMKSGHRGPITTLSRRGQLPRPHAPTRPDAIRLDEIPVDQPLSQLLRWLRGRIAWVEADGGTWRDVIDGLRPHVSAIWQVMPVEKRARFLRHLVSWWDVHRHRIPAASDRRIADAVASGKLTHRRGAFLRAERGENGLLRAYIRPHGQTDESVIEAARIIDCRGIRNDPEYNATPLIADLLASGRARVDELRIGLQVSATCQLIDAADRASSRILAIGPVSRAAFWEITAIPDIRVQTAALARRIAKLVRVGA